jgi:hypothetical protein
MRTGRIVAAMALAVLTVSACGTAASSRSVAHTAATTHASAANPSTPGCNQINSTLDEAFGNGGLGIALTLYSLVGNFSYMPGDWLKANHVQGVR